MIERTQEMSENFSTSSINQPRGAISPSGCAAIVVICVTTGRSRYSHKHTILKSTQETSLNSPTLLGSALHWLTPLTDQRRLFVPMSKAAQRHCSISGLLCSTLIFAASQPISFHAGAKLCAALWGRLLFLFSGMTLCSVMKGKVISMHITRCGILAKRQKTYPEM